MTDEVGVYQDENIRNVGTNKAHQPNCTKKNVLNGRDSGEFSAKTKPVCSTTVSNGSPGVSEIGNDNYRLWTQNSKFTPLKNSKFLCQLNDSCMVENTYCPQFDIRNRASRTSVVNPTSESSNSIAINIGMWNEKKQKYSADEFSLAIISAQRAVGCDVDFLVHQPMIISYRGICFPQSAEAVIGLGLSKVTVSDLCLLAIVGSLLGRLDSSTLADEVSVRISKARITFDNLRHLWRQKGISLDLKGRVYQATTNQDDAPGHENDGDVRVNTTNYADHFQSRFL
ncbi:polyprotein [Clonorchis sinensis]|uniref:Polyprotein n=1 Tax=Clonorchis sinensis TaxID=79923 RepID=G7YJ01_CLOSI|nr:polyprotein [Clonorchis sinensis]